ncbi:response regulator receiver domain [Marinomonas mediterranea]|uniref:response regulator receiver domain n=1 Tax=Marinomonas mediterranea TaxID=119864 RepID=UPI0023498A5E|nr:response regulator receiver domain [Marinomonas mediterranea]WCN11154.1 hypothetical protein GV055_20575 [Marinomonas mediterranea]
MTAAYKQKITQAFRDNSIKSVLLIDDEYQSYEALVENKETFNKKLVELENSDITDIDEYKKALSDILNTDKVNIGNKTENFIRRSSKAQQLTNFFHSKKKICSVESNIEQLEVEKIRKSDLVVLDYHLNPEKKGNEALSSLKLISDLSNNKHMNIVVVYTNEELETVWQQIAAVLYGDRSESIELLEDELDAWDRNQPDWEEEWRNSVFDKSMLRKHLFGDLDYQLILSDLKDLVDDDTSNELTISHIKKLVEKSILNLNLIKAKETSFTIHGTEAQWIQAGHVFIALKSKQDDNDDPKDIWDCIETCLHDWKPSFYRLITSELQNQIEDANLSMEKVLSTGKMEQISMLWGILRVAEDARKDAAKDMLENLLNDVSENIRNAPQLIDFVLSSANSTSEEKPDFVSKGQNRDNHNKFINAMLDISAKNYEKVLEEDINSTYRANIVHAFNEQLCTVKEEVRYISTGVVIKDTTDGDYYLCIAPSCNTVPNQPTGGSIAVAMTPHRAMRFIRLKVADNLQKALKKAHDSDTIFISFGEERLALKVYETDGVPNIDQGFVVNHDDEQIEKGATKKIRFVITNANKDLEIVEKRFLPIAKLRPGFASRYQNAQLQYEARIGVDFMSATIT